MSYDKQAVCLLVQRGNSYLVVTRKDQVNRVCMPGGKVDLGEDVVQAIVREVGEETGAIVDLSLLVPVYSGMCGEYWATTFLYRGLVFDADLTPEEGTTLHWITAQQLCDPNVSAFADYNAKALKAMAP